MTESQYHPLPSLPNDVYFSSYEDLSVHELMLKDKPRTTAYKDYMEKNADIFKDKIVIDVGAGSGILSLFAAKAGAKKVYAIEASNMSKLCQSVVNQNKLDNIIEVVHGRVEDVVLPIKKADVLISEWMGFYLLHEAMLNSVIIARDRWLTYDGIMVPSTVALNLCPVQMLDYYKENFACWSNAYGCDLTPIGELVKRKALTQPVIMQVEESHLLSTPELVMHLDLKYVAEEDIESVVGNFKFPIKKHGVCHGFALWFDCLFEGSENVMLSTAPQAAPTHWQQTVMILPDAYFVNRDESLNCSMQMSRHHDHPRRYTIGLEVLEEEDEVPEPEMDEEDEEDDEALAGGDVKMDDTKAQEHNDEIKKEILRAMQGPS